MSIENTKNSELIIPKILNGSVSGVALSKFFGISPERLRVLKNEGVIVASGRKYDFFRSTRSYIDRLRDGASKKQGGTLDDQLKEAKIREIDQRLAINSRELIPLDEAMGGFDAAAGMILEVFSGLPSQISRDVRERKRIEEICDIARRALATQFSKIAAGIQSAIEDPDTQEED